MAAVDVALNWLERVGDRLNPILVKETRQALKSRQFVTTFMLLLAASWLISVFLMLNQREAIEYGAIGTTFFYSYYVVLAVAVFLIVPFSTFRSLLAERELNTYELLSISALTPKQIVWGKLLSAVVQMFIFYSAITPFIAFSSLLQGFDAPSAAYILVMSLVASFALSMGALTLSTLGHQRQSQGIISICVLVALLVVLWLALGSVFAVIQFSQISLDERSFWFATGVWLILVAAYFVLFQQIATAQLTFESDNRSSGIRAVCTGHFCLWLLFWGSAPWLVPWAMGNPLFRSYGRDEAQACLALAGIHCAVVGLFVATESDSLSRRIRRGLPRRRLMRLLIAPFLPGGMRGLVYLVLHLAALCVFAAAMSAFGLTTWDASLNLGLGIAGYILIYVGGGATLGRWLRTISSEIRPAHARVFSVLLLLAGLIAPYIPIMAGKRVWQGYTLWHISNPFESLDAMLAGNQHSNSILLLVGIGAGLVLTANIGAMWRSITEVLYADVPDRNGSSPR